ncbi:DUF5719 family protein [Streptomyces sp. NPDC050610]|uniref:DUF5719 family protein n=1 Tax=Streptomyces sp. NPDC050610 TaxID=3157097 RepID=UPI00344845EB
MNRTTLTFFGAVAALAAVTGVAAVTVPSEPAKSAAKTAERLPVQRSTLVCPSPTSSEVGETTYTAFTPQGKGGANGSQKSAGKSTADMLPASGSATGGSGGKKDEKKDEKGKKGGKDAKGGKDPKDPQDPKGTAKPVISAQEPGKPVTATTDSSDAPALIGSADGALAPGWSVQQTTTISAGSGRGVQGLTCAAPDTSLWFPGASTGKSRQDYVHLTNPDSTPAVVDLELYGKDGRIKAPTGEGINVPPRSTVPVLLSTLASQQADDVVLHVAARSGRVGAAVQASDEKAGGDWLSASAEAASGAVFPGVPADATSVRLVAFAPGGSDADLKVKLAGKSSSFTPAGHESLHVKSGMMATADLGDVTRGEAGSLLLTSEGGSGKVVAALRVTRGKGDKQETAFIPATRPIEERGTVADNRAKGTTLSLVAPEKDAEVKVTSSAGSEGGTPVSKNYTVKAGTTLAVEPPQPGGGKGAFGVTVEKTSGGPVYASRMLALPEGGVPMFTVQTLPDDRGTVEVPEAEQRLSLLND